MNDTYKVSKQGTNIVKVYKIPKQAKRYVLNELVPIYTTTNLVTNEMAQIKANEHHITHMYIQFGEAVDFPENGGPYITPLKANTILDLDGVNFASTSSPILYEFLSTQENQSEYTNNVKNYIALFAENDTKSHIGVGLVSEVSPSVKLLAAHTALSGVIKNPGSDIIIAWSITYTN